VGRPGERLPQNLALKPLRKLAAYYIFWQKTSKMRRESENGCGLGKKNFAVGPILPEKCTRPSVEGLTSISL
jgi:hypothetical protein